MEIKRAIEIIEEAILWCRVEEDLQALRAAVAVLEQHQKEKL